MEKLHVKWRVPARDGNTCYRPGSDPSELREVFEETLSSLGINREVTVEEVLVTDPNRARSPLVVEGRTLHEWLEGMSAGDRTFYESEVRPALISAQFESLTEERFLQKLLREILSDE